MLNTNLIHFLCLITLFIATVNLIDSPIQIQGQPIASESNCFPVQPNSLTLICTDGPESGQDENSTLVKDTSVSRDLESNCFPVQPNSLTLICTDGPESGEDEN